MQNRSQIVRRIFTIFTLSLCVVFPAQSFAVPTVPYLAQLTATGVTIQPAFRPTTLHYTASIGESVNGLTINAVPQDPKTTVIVSGNTDLAPGANTITILLATPEKTSQTYTIIVTKAGGVSKQNANLFSLDIGNWTLSPAFSSETTSYATDVDQNTERLTIGTATENPQSKVAITGNSHLKTGINQVKIEVTSADGALTKTYMITVNKLPGSPKNLDAQGSLKPQSPHYELWLLWVALGVLVLGGIIAIIIIRIRRRKEST